MMMYFPIILLYGAFSMTPNQYRATAALMILGYITVVLILFKLYPRRQLPIVGVSDFVFVFSI
jgi:hypothetical protein